MYAEGKKYEGLKEGSDAKNEKGHKITLNMWPLSNPEWFMHDTNSPRDITPNTDTCGWMYRFINLQRNKLFIMRYTILSINNNKYLNKKNMNTTLTRKINIFWQECFNISRKINSSKHLHSFKQSEKMREQTITAKEKLARVLAWRRINETIKG